VAGMKGFEIDGIESLLDCSNDGALTLMVCYVM
jgi:hypothetical protein